ncbi:hypothetical protein B0H11DRAFT_2056691, partial [Mycena galericulata]
CCQCTAHNASCLSPSPTKAAVMKVAFIWPCIGLSTFLCIPEFLPSLLSPHIMENSTVATTLAAIVWLQSKFFQLGAVIILVAFTLTLYKFLRDARLWLLYKWRLLGHPRLPTPTPVVLEDGRMLSVGDVADMLLELQRGSVTPSREEEIYTTIEARYPTGDILAALKAEFSAPIPPFRSSKLLHNLAGVLGTGFGILLYAFVLPREIGISLEKPLLENVVAVLWFLFDGVKVLVCLWVLAYLLICGVIWLDGMWQRYTAEAPLLPITAPSPDEAVFDEKSVVEAPVLKDEKDRTRWLSEGKA